VRIGSGINENNFKVLRPRDGSAQLDGKFPCGRNVGIEGKEFRLPKDLICDSCTLQLEWHLAADVSINQCADISILDGESLVEDKSFAGFECAGLCQNGGSCANGACICRDGFVGEFCEH